MKNITVKHRLLKGDIKIPPSKSLAHRAIIAAALSEEESILYNIQYSRDIIATINIMRSLGASIIEADNNTLHINGTGFFNSQTTENLLQCDESGSTLRFLVPVALVKGGNFTFDGKGKLKERPMKPYYDIFNEKNISYNSSSGLPLRVMGKLESGRYSLPGNVSSQFITGLMFALPLLDGDSIIHITTELESKAYVDLTMQVLRKFGIEIINRDYREFIVHGNQQYTACRDSIEGDFSQGAFYLVAGAIGSDINCRGLDIESLQGDKAILDILRSMGCRLDITEQYIKALPSVTNGVDIDVSQCPDLVPVLGVLGCMSKGRTRILNAGRLRYKECDRLMATASELNKLGGKITELEDSLIIEGIDSFHGGHVDSHNDHRIAMALSIAATRATGEVIIDNPMTINKSYPDFYKDYVTLGGDIDGLDNRR